MSNNWNQIPSKYLAEAIFNSIGLPTGLDDNSMLKYDASQELWIATLVNLNDFNDFNIVGQTNGQIIIWNDQTSNWENQDLLVESLMDIDINALSDGHILKYDSSSGKWINLANTAMENPTSVDLDMDGNRIINLGTGIVGTHAVNLAQLNAEITSHTHTQYVSLTANENIDGDKIFTGDIIMCGSLTCIDNENLYIKDNEIVLNDGETGSGVSAGSAGIRIDRGSSSDALLCFNESDDTWYHGLDGSMTAIGSGGGGGDMFKSAYDTNSNNIVDKSESLDDGLGNVKTAAEVKTHIDSTPSIHFTKANISLSELGNVEASGATLGQFLCLNGTSCWVPVTLNAGDMLCSEFAESSGVVKDSARLCSIEAVCYARRDSGNTFLATNYYCSSDPGIHFYETGLGTGCGRHRILGNIDTFSIQRNTAAAEDFSTRIELVTFSSTQATFDVPLYCGVNEVWHAGNDGIGSGLNADLLDGNHAAAFQLADKIGDYNLITGVSPASCSNLRYNGTNNRWEYSPTAYGDAGVGNYGGIFYSNNFGVYGCATNSYGGAFYADNFGVLGCVSTNNGVLGQAPAGIMGVQGQANSIGVCGCSATTFGVKGSATTNFGVAGYANDATGVFGTYGKAFNKGSAGWAVNSMGVIGTANIDPNGITPLSAGYGGVYGEASTECGVIGIAPSRGIYGEATSGSIGIYGCASVSVGICGVATNYGVKGTANSYGIYGIATAGTHGVYGCASTNYGIYGCAGTSVGIFGQAANQVGVQGNAPTIGIKGLATSTTVGVYGCATTNIGVCGEAVSQCGVYGKAGTSIAVYGCAPNIGVYGCATTNCGVEGCAQCCYGGKFRSQCDYGVHGQSNIYGGWFTAGSYGVVGQAIGSGGDYGGCFLTSSGDYGVCGRAASGNYGVSGSASNGNYGVYGCASNYGVYGCSTGTGSCGIVAAGPSGGYNFFAVGAGTDYGSFTGGHDVVHNTSCSYEQGMLLSVTGCVYKRDDSISNIVPAVEPACVEKSTSIYGIYAAAREIDDKHWLYTQETISCAGIANAVGEGQALVTDIRGDVCVGDLLTSSTRAGYAVVQTEDDNITKDNIIRNYTAARAMEDVDWSLIETDTEKGFKWQMVAVVYLSG